jgi:putative FmdB family regulatory protein
MPTYDYVCEGCGHKFEHFQSMTSRRLRTCPECRERKLTRLVGSGAGVIFKGSGFYETDYKRAGEKRDDAPTPAVPAPAGGASKAKASDAKSTTPKAGDGNKAGSGKSGGSGSGNGSD